MSERIQMIDYDAINDILYIRFPSDRGMSYGTDGPVGIEIMRDMETEELTGIVVFYAKKKKEDRQTKIDAMGFGIDIGEILRGR